MLLLFLFASIPMMEKRSLERRPSYQDVVDRVPMLLPRPPRARACPPVRIGTWNLGASGRKRGRPCECCRGERALGDGADCSSAGGIGGRAVLLEAIETLGLTVPTAALPHRIDGLLSIDHIAVPPGPAPTATAVSAIIGDRALSDHDAYVVDL